MGVASLSLDLPLTAENNGPSVQLQYLYTYTVGYKHLSQYIHMQLATHTGILHKASLRGS